MLKLHSIRNQMLLNFLAIVLMAMIISGLFLYNRLEHYYTNYQKEIMLYNSNTVAELISGYLREEADTVRISSIAENFSRQSYPHSRIIILDSQARVVGDSLQAGGMLGKTLALHEVDEALAQRDGFSIQFSEELNNWLMQVAIPVTDESRAVDGQPLGAIFLSASMKNIHHILASIRMYLFWSTLAAVILATMTSFFLSRRFTEPLALLTNAAQKMAEGDLEQKIGIRSKDEIGQLAQQFNLMAEKINYMTRNLKSFAANVSHELRTPLTTINLLIKSLQEHDLEEEQKKEFLQDIERETERLTNLVTDLLELTKLESFKAREMKKQFSLRTVLLEVIEQMTPWFIREGVSFIHDIPMAILMLSGSPVQVRQVVYNLVNNALRHTDPGGKVSLLIQEEDDQIKVSVADTGCGIPAEKIPYIFEKFYRVDEARSREHGGIGLGLAIVKEIVEAHEGEIVVESELEKGSVFTVIFPKAVALPVVPRSAETEKE